MNMQADMRISAKWLVVIVNIITIPSNAGNSLLCSCVVPCIFNNPRCCRFVFLCKRPKVKRLLHNTCVFNQREADLGVATSSLIRQSTA